MTTRCLSMLLSGVNGNNSAVVKESEQYGDIIQIDKVDYYYHNSCKFSSNHENKGRH